MQITGRLQYVVLGAVVSALLFVLFPFVIHEDHSRAFIYTKQIPAQDIVIDAVHHEVSIAPQSIQLRDGKYSGTARIAVASNTMIVDEIELKEENSIVDTIWQGVPWLAGGLIIGGLIL